MNKKSKADESAEKRTCKASNFQKKAMKSELQQPKAKAGAKSGATATPKGIADKGVKLPTGGGGSTPGKAFKGKK